MTGPETDVGASRWFMGANIVLENTTVQISEHGG